MKLEHRSALQYDEEDEAAGRGELKDADPDQGGGGVTP